MKTPLPQVWNMDRIFAGGSASSEFSVFVEETDKLVADLARKLKGAEPPASKEGAWGLMEAINLMQTILFRARESESFVGCLAAANTSDKKRSSWTDGLKPNWPPTNPL